MSNTKRNTYRGKYPNRIKAVWGTTTKGVYGCETNKGERFFFATREMIAAGYKVSASQILKMDATELKFLTPSIADAAKRAEPKIEYKLNQRVTNKHSSKNGFVVAIEQGVNRLLKVKFDLSKYPVWLPDSDFVAR